MVAQHLTDDMFLPWVESANDRRFKRILIAFVTSFAVISAVVPFLPLPEIVQKDLKSVAPHISRLIMEKKKEAPQPKPEIKKKIKKKAIKKNKEQERKEAVYKKAASSGLVALSNELADLHDSFDFPMVDTKPLKQSKGIDKQHFNNDLIVAKAKSSSAGIKTDVPAQASSGIKLSERATSNVTSSIADNVQLARKSSSSDRKLVRSEREIEQVFQKYKGAIYNIYNRALRKDPTLEGKVVIELTISAAGKVIRCHIVSSELNSPALEKKIIARVKSFKFKPSDASETTIKYPIDFLPS